MVKQIKAEKYKVQTSIQQDQIRVTGKKRAELQTVIAFLKKTDFDDYLKRLEKCEKKAKKAKDIAKKS